MTPLLYALPGNEPFAGGLARAWPAEVGSLATHRFPDGETLVRLDSGAAGRDVVLVCTLHDPDPKLIPLLLAADTAHDLGARSVGLIAPYLSYMRQDKRFHAGEGRSAAYFARLLSQHFDWLVTVDPHLHRFHALDELYSIPTVAVPAAPLLAAWIAANVERPLLIGPDEESRQWITAIALAADLPWRVLEKMRAGDRTVAVRVPDLSGHEALTPVLADDIISTGATLADTIRQLRVQGLAAPVCVAVHAVFAPYAYAVVLDSGAARVATTNTIEHASNCIDVAPAVAAASRDLLARLPLRGTFAA
jgi:ribose-phosphate pyrophosphokinase